MKAVGIFVFTTLMASFSVLAQSPNALDDIAKRGTVKVGWSVYFPYAFRDPQTKELRGITIDLIQDIAKELKVKPEFVEDSTATLIAGLQARKFDFTMPLAITLQRATAVSYSEPVTRINFGLMVRKEDASKYNSWMDVDKSGLRITTTLGSSAQPLLAKFKHAQAVLVRDGPTSINDLLSKRADAWLSTLDSFKFVEKEQTTLTILPGPVVGHQDVAIPVRQNDRHLRDWLSHYVREIKNTGKLLAIIEKYGLNESYIAK